MKNIATGLLWFSAGVGLTLFFTRGKGQRWMEELSSNFISDEAVTEDDVKQAVRRVNGQFHQVRKEADAII